MQRALLTLQVKLRHALAVLSPLKSSLLATTGAKEPETCPKSRFAQATALGIVSMLRWLETHHTDREGAPFRLRGELLCHARPHYVGQNLGLANRPKANDAGASTTLHTQRQHGVSPCKARRDRGQ